jgi:hypothetical protein
MPDARGLYFIAIERQRTARLEADEERRKGYTRPDAPPFPAEPQRERSDTWRELVIRLRSIVRPNRRALP